VADRIVELLLEAHVAARDDADQLAVVVDHRHAGDVAGTGVSLSTSEIVVSGPTVNGSLITPASNFFTAATSPPGARPTCSCAVMAMPPKLAIAMARRLG
jgi:hypothetical protein